GTVLECSTIAGESPVRGRGKRTIWYLSKTGHVKVGLNLRGPSRKAKYSLATDSVAVARAKDGKNPYQGRIVNLKPHAYKRSEPVYQGSGIRGQESGVRSQRTATAGC